MEVKYKHVDFPRYTLMFINTLLKRLRHYGMIDVQSNIDYNGVPVKLTVPITTAQYPYCHDGVNLINKTFERMGFKCRLISYGTKVDNDKKCHYNYTFELERNKNSK